MMTSDIGVLGLGVMGANLARNIERNGFTVSVYNRRTEVTGRFVAENAGKKFFGAPSPEKFVRSLKRPRRILMMVKAGQPVDEVMATLRPHLDAGDILIDGGNSLYSDTERRAAGFENFIGMGVSGGEEGALYGPSLMPGGSRDAYAAVEPILRKISAKADGEDCCAYIGPGGAGHFVKMVHNGIEYGDMQLICEAYQLLRQRRDVQKIFARWNAGALNSFLIEITGKILATKDPKTGQPMVDVILDRAGQKGTGKWTINVALDFGVPASTMSEAVFARMISALKDERLVASKQLKTSPARLRVSPAAVRDALYASKICSYAQGFALLRAASKEKDWNLNLGEIAKIWRAGCIIRAKFLFEITKAFAGNPELPNLLLDRYFKKSVLDAQKNWRSVVCKAAAAGVPVPAFSASLAYFDSYRAKQLPANLLQAQRDYFGAHTYERVDAPAGKHFHLDWIGDQQEREV